MFSQIKLLKEKERGFSPLQHEYETLKKELEANQQRREKVLLYEDNLFQKEDLVQRLSTWNEEKERLEERLSPIEFQRGERRYLIFLMMKQVMQNFKGAIKNHWLGSKGKG